MTAIICVKMVSKKLKLGIYVYLSFGIPYLWYAWLRKPKLTYTMG